MPLEEGLAERAELPALPPVDGVEPRPEPIAASRLDLAEHEEVPTHEHQVELTDPAPPVACDDAEPSSDVPGLGGRFARTSRARSCIHARTIRPATDTLARQTSGVSGMLVSSRRSSSTFTSRRVITRTVETNRAGRNMSQTHASPSSTWTHPSSSCATSTLLAR